MNITAVYLASKDCFLAWLLELQSRIAWLVNRVNKATTRLTSHANDFANAKSHARKKPRMLVGNSVLYGGLRLLQNTDWNYGVIFEFLYSVIGLFLACEQVPALSRFV